MTVFTDIPKPSPTKNSAVALGIFDGLHRGHMAVINQMLDNSNALDTVVFTFNLDDIRPDAKSNQHIITESARNKILESIGIDYVFEPEFARFRDMPPDVFVSEFLCDYLGARRVFCGEDFRFGKGAAGNAAMLADLLALHGAKLETIPLVYSKDMPISSTSIRELITAGDIKSATDFLGRPFALEFPVETGNRIGRTIGLPTCNQRLPNNFAKPKFGVYSTATIVENKTYKSITNIGIKPTIGSDHVVCETHILGFCGDLYGQTIKVELIDFLRPEQKFDSIDQLKQQIKKDIEKISKQ